MSDIYDQDLLTWSAQQAALLRRRAAGELVNETDIDWQNVADEIDHLGGNVARPQQPAPDDPRPPAEACGFAGDRSSAGLVSNHTGAAVRNRRTFELAPSLRPTVQAAIDKQLGRASAEARASLSDHGETPRLEIDGRTFTEDQVLGDWFPDPHR